MKPASLFLYEIAFHLDCMRVRRGAEGAAKLTQIGNEKSQKLRSFLHGRRDPGSSRLDATGGHCDEHSRRKMSFYPVLTLFLSLLQNEVGALSTALSCRRAGMRQALVKWTGRFNHKRWNRRQ